MRGHAAANIVPVLASTRIGTESDKESSMTIFGSSFIADEDGKTVNELSRNEEDVAVAEFDLAKID